jgi:hypothetical protein
MQSIDTPFPWFEVYERRGVKRKDCYPRAANRMIVGGSGGAVLADAPSPDSKSWRSWIAPIEGKNYRRAAALNLVVATRLNGVRGEE